MPDIQMCKAGSCDLAKNCRRHADSGTKPGGRQAYGMPLILNGVRADHEPVIRVGAAVAAAIVMRNKKQKRQ